MRVLIIVDPQNDFFTGSLAVNGSLLIIPYINLLIESGKFDIIIITQDWHPKGHKSFASTHNKDVFTVIDLNGYVQMLWPDHCGQDTNGAEIHPDIVIPKNVYFFKKGCNIEVDSYSAFFDNGRMPLGLTEFLREKGITETYICGLALDYCCKFTALDSQSEGFVTTFIMDATKAVDPDSISSVTDELEQAGVLIVNTDDLLDRL